MNIKVKSAVRVNTIILAVLLGIFFVSGCGEVFSQKPTEIQAREIVRDIRKIKPNPNIRNPLPELYRQPAERIAIKDGIKLLYFAKNLAVENVSERVKNLGYKTDISSPTNQLIVYCEDDEEADRALEFLRKVDVPPIQVNIDCLILERFADVTADWETTLFIENIMGEGITIGGKTDASGDLLANFPGASLRESKRALFGMDVGYWHSKGVLGHQVRLLVDLLVSRGYLKILMNPTLETINGQTARIVSRENVPLEKILTKAGFDEPFSLTDYQWVEDILEVTPRVYSDGSIGLDTKVQIGSKSKPEGVVQVSIITERTIEVKENRIKPGESLVIGGIRKSVQRSVIRGVPFLKDIPVVGVLFSSKDFEESATEVIFILTPTISSGGSEYTEVIEDVKDKMAKPVYDVGLHEAIIDPFGTSIYTERVEQKAAEAEFERFKAELEKAEATEEIEEVKDRLLNTAYDVLVEKTKAVQARQQAEAAKEEAESLKEEAEKARTESKQLQEELDKAKADAEKAKLESEEAKKETEKEE